MPFSSARRTDAFETLPAKIDVLKNQVRIAVRNNKVDIKTRLFLIDGAFHVLYALHLICTKQKIDHYDFHAVSGKINAACQLVNKVVDNAKKGDAGFSFNRFFKDARTKELIAAAV